MNTEKTQEALRFALRATAKGVISEADLDTVYNATPTDMVVEVATWASGKESTQKLLTRRLKQDGDRIADLVTLHHGDNGNAVVLNVLANHALASMVHQVVVEVFELADTARHASAKGLLDIRPTTYEALVKFLRTDTKSPEENRRRLRVGAHAKCAGVIPPDELQRLFNSPKSSTANLVEEGVLLTPAGQAEITEYLRTNAHHVGGLFRQYIEHPTNAVVLAAISGHTSDQMDAMLRVELLVHDEDDQMTNAAAQLIMKRLEVKADSNTETAETRIMRKAPKPAEGEAKPAPTVEPTPDPTPAEGEAVAEETAEGDAASL